MLKRKTVLITVWIMLLAAWVFGGMQMGNPAATEPYWAFVALFNLFFSAVIMIKFVIPMHKDKEKVGATILFFYCIVFVLLSAKWLLTH